MHRTKTTAMRRIKITALIALSSVAAFVFALSLTSPAGGETRAAAAGSSQSHRTTAVPISGLKADSNAANSNGSYKDLGALQAAPSPCNTYSYFVSTGSIVPGTTDTGNHTDDDSTVIALPFSYQLYDSTFDAVVVGSNGHLTFGTVNDDWDLTCIPVAISTYAIGPYWTDLCTGACDNVSGENLGIFTSTSGSAPNRIFNIEWRAAYYYNGNQATTIPLNFEVRLYEGLGEFDIIYGTMQPTFTPPDARTLTVGVQQSDTTLNTLVGCDTNGGVSPPVSSGQLYHFVKEGCSSPSPTATATATASPAPTPTATPPPTPSPTPTPTPNCGDVFLDENFDGVTAPALPPGWSSSVTFLGSFKFCAPTCPPLPNWTTSTTAPHSAPNCAFHFGASCLSASYLYSPSFSNGVGGDFLFFQHSYDFQTGGDGAVLEFSLNGGAFTDFVAAGGTFLNGTGYNGTLSYFHRQAWTGSSGDYRPVVAMMPPGSQGNVVLRFVVLTDCFTESVGWRLDDIKVASFVPCPSPTPSPTPPSPTPTATAPTPTPTLTPSPTPTATATASPPPGCATFIPPVPDRVGTVYYCSTAAPMPGVTVRFYNACGAQAGSTTTDANGQYVFHAPFCKSGAGGYATCSKADQIPGSPGINTVDVVAVQRHFLGIGPPLPGCRVTAANVNGDASINTVDVIAIQRFFLGFSTSIANVGKYQFTPPYRCHTHMFGPPSDFDTIIFGDVATPFIY